MSILRRSGAPGHRHSTSAVYRLEFQDVCGVLVLCPADVVSVVSKYVAVLSASTYRVQTT